MKPENTLNVSRREFVKSSAAAVAVGTLATPILAHAGGSDRIKVGLIGCGGRGTGAAVQALRADPGVVLWSMGDVFKDRLETCHTNLRTAMAALDEEESEGSTRWRDRIEVAEERRFLGFDAYRHVIDSGVDAVLLTSYPCFRPREIAYAVERGKHAFAEKPVAVDGPGLRSVLASAEAARRQNLGLLVGFCWRYNAGMRACFEQVNGGALGRVTTVHTTYHTGTLPRRPRQEGWSDLEFQMRNWWHFTWISGDHIVEQAVHSVDRTAWAMGDLPPARVTCLGGRAARSGPEHGNVFDHFAAVYEYEDGRRAFHTCRQIDHCPGDNTDYVYGTEGSAIVNGWAPTYAVKGLDGAERWRFRGPIKDMYQVEHDDLFASIRAGTPINDCARGANSTLMAIMARMAAYTGQTVSWEQALNSQESLMPETLEWGDLPTPPIAVPGQTKLA